MTGLSALCLAGIFVYVAKPHIKRHEWRASARPTTIQVMYVAMACGEYSPRLYEVVAQNDNSQRWSRSPTILALPKGMPSPEDTEFAVSGNVFVLTGFRYRGKERNVLTGETKDYRAARFDVTAWEIRTPYNVWTASGKWDMRHRPHSVVATANRSTRFAMRNYQMC